MKRFIKIVLIFVLILVLWAGFTILTRPKGEWACKNGEWVKLGKPRKPKPSWDCPRPEKKPMDVKEDDNGNQPKGTPLEFLQLPDFESWDIFPEGYKESTPSLESTPSAE